MPENLARPERPTTPADDESVVDPAQLIRITSLHRGFLYQHLYAVGCLLRMTEGGAHRLLVERDEDIEVVLPGRRVYLQVKTRSRNLRWGDIRNAVDNYAAVRALHEEGVRPGRPSLVIVTDTAVGPVLADQIASEQWPSDVHVLGPGASVTEPWLPPAWTDIEEALTWCADEAERIPFSSLAPRTLVWKLAARIAHACTGHQGQALTPGELPDLFEQFVTELQAFPALPDPYLPQADEPPLLTDARVRLITGFSGAGKTAWATHAATHCPDPLVYFDVAAFTGEAAAGSLARELAARHLDAEQRTELVHGAGIDVLRSIHRRLADTRLTIVLDNVHRIDATPLQQIVDTLSSARFILLGQPRRDQVLLAARLDITVETLTGWSADSAAAAFATAESPADGPTVRRILHLTGGLPLYVRGAAVLARTQYGGDPARMCDALTERRHTTPTAQDLILGEVFDSLDPRTHTIAFLLAYAETPLTQDELTSLAHTTGLTAADCARALRDLTSLGVVQRTGSDLITLHDAARAPATEYRPAREAEEAVARTLRDVLGTSLQAGSAPVGRLARWVMLLARTGQTEELIRLATHDIFFEHSFSSAVRPTIAAVARDTDAEPGARFDALNALALLADGANDADSHRRLTEEMGRLAAAHPDVVGPRETCVLATQTMLWQAGAGDVRAMNTTYLAACEQIAGNALGLRILRYTQATGFYVAEQYVQASILAQDVAEHYYAHLGLTTADVVGVGIEPLAEHLARTGADLDDCKRLADCLSLIVRCNRQQGFSRYGLAALHAMKFYHLARVWRSAVEMGQEVADDFVEIGEPHQALVLLEQTLLPLADRHVLTNLTLGLRAQRAVVLAYCGDQAAARAEIDALRRYDVTPEQAQELDGQRALIERLAQPQAEH
ncbi:AAA family ATPase [Streptomyces sp. NPDC056508]|uniref:AAA family ATPase n=1 Tax=Streptomyces sp. NPDC056508 TaxID=3345845 RepID=UPI00367891E0